MDKDLTIALLIDCDNLSTSYYDIILDELAELGQVRYKRAYADFSNKTNNSWSNLAISKGIMPVHAFTPVKGKNTADMSIAIDAMDLHHDSEVDAFCLATSDSDFCRLAQRLKEGGEYVIIAGKENSHESLSNSCHKFIMLDKLKKILDEQKSKTVKNVKEEKAKKTTTAKVTPKASTKKAVKEEEEVIALVEKDDQNVLAPQKDELRNKVAEYLEKSKNYSDGWAHYSEIINMLEKQYPQFNYKIYGARGKQDFFVSTLGCVIKTVDTTCLISMNGEKKIK